MFSQKSTGSLRTGSLGFPWFETHRSIRRRFPGGRVLIASHRAGNASVLSFLYSSSSSSPSSIYSLCRRRTPSQTDWNHTRLYIAKSFFFLHLLFSRPHPLASFLFFGCAMCASACFLEVFVRDTTANNAHWDHLPSSLLLVALLTARSIVQHRKSDPFIFAKVLECPHWKPGASLAKGSLQFSFRYIDCIQLFFIPFFFTLFFFLHICCERVSSHKRHHDGQSRWSIRTCGPWCRWRIVGKKPRVYCLSLLSTRHKRILEREKRIAHI